MISKLDIADAQKEMTEKIFLGLDGSCYLKDIAVGIRNHALLGPCITAKVAANFVIASRAQAFIQGFDFVAPFHIREVCRSVFEHTFVFKSELPFTSPLIQAQCKGLRTIDILEDVLTQTPPPV